jgi:hypothetical protein
MHSLQAWPLNQGSNPMYKQFQGVSCKNQQLSCHFAQQYFPAGPISNIVHMKINRLPRAGIDLLLYWRCTRCRLEPGFQLIMNQWAKPWQSTQAQGTQEAQRHTRGTQARKPHFHVACVLRTL